MTAPPYTPRAPGGCHSSLLPLVWPRYWSMVVVTVYLCRDPVQTSAMPLHQCTLNELTGAITDREVNSRTFSIGAFERSPGLGGTSVGPGILGD